MKISLIVAIGANGEIGFKNSLLWHLPGDLKYFKNITMGHPMIMGRKTFESIGRALPGRMSIVISSDAMYREKVSAMEHCIGASSLSDALEIVKSIGDDFLTHPHQPFITGGAQVYRQALEGDIIDTVYLTRVESAFEADTFFPVEKLKKYIEIWSEKHEKDEKNPYDFSYIKMIKSEK
ncbi:MAG: dihydrofolate reductase [Flavobacteriales bacterium]|nr:dihydrofolate reductase [Flavobacteriales bacterium]